MALEDLSRASMLKKGSQQIPLHIRHRPPNMSDTYRGGVILGSKCVQVREDADLGLQWRTRVTFLTAGWLNSRVNFLK